MPEEKSVHDTERDRIAGNWLCSHRSPALPVAAKGHFPRQRSSEPKRGIRKGSGRTWRLWMLLAGFRGSWKSSTPIRPRSRLCKRRDPWGSPITGCSDCPGERSLTLGSAARSAGCGTPSYPAARRARHGKHADATAATGTSTRIRSLGSSSGTWLATRMMPAASTALQAMGKRSGEVQGSWLVATPGSGRPTMTQTRQSCS